MTTPAADSAVSASPRRLALAALGAATVAAANTGCAVAATAPRGPRPGRAEATRLVGAAESAFAQTMADRDFGAFMAFVSDEAVFLNGGEPLRGRAAVAAHWQRFFTGPAAPFAWRPDRVEVLDSGLLAQTVGPVSSPEGVVFARFYSTWRLDADGGWRVVFDDGYPVCAPAKAG